MGKPYPRSDYQRCGTDNECVVASHQEECCGVQKFTWDNYTCCDRKLVTVKTASSQDKCCYNDRNGTGKSYASITQDCVRGEVKPKAKRCGHGKYNDSSDLCCDYNLYRGVLDLDKDNKCCGSNFYNNKTQQCCSFKVVNGTQCPDPSQNITCHLCAKNRREVAEKIENGELDSAICALKLAYVAVVHRQIVDYDNQTMKYVIQRPSRNLFNRRLEIRHKYLLLPWVCKKNFSRIIVVTSNPGKKTRELSCYERDILLPYSKRIKKAVTMRKYFCLKLY
ncbi:uncharacterized protein [Argopecten irradians]|uniref:uncharacterized protein n=1 Tax=Argopecten irradians TaxID=31199 RepID=UPI0037187979